MTPDALKHAIKQIKMDETMQARVLRRSLDYAKEHDTMKQKKSWKRIAIIAAAAVIVLSATAFAAVRSQVFVSWSDGSYLYQTIDEAQKAMEQAGGTLSLPEAFSNGYTFKGAYQDHQMAAEAQESGAKDNGMVFTFMDGTQQEGLTCDYSRSDETVSLSAAKADSPAQDAAGENSQILELEGVTFLCSEDSVASVSTTATGDGSVVESSGEPQEGLSRSVSWQVEGVSYQLSQLDGSLTWNELCQMALELCSQA